MVKRILGILAILCMSLQLFAHDFYYNGFYYNRISASTVEVTYDNLNYTLYSGSKEIPRRAQGYDVVRIGKNAFAGCTNLTNVTIPSSVTSIGDYAFSHCTGLTSFTIPNSVTSIGGYAFKNCSGLLIITIPNSVTNIQDGAFYGCNSLVGITIPNSITSISSLTFYGCYSLAGVNLPNSVTSIGDGAFSNCRSLTNFAIPNSVTSLGDYVFSRCTGFTSFTIPNSVTSIGSGVLQYCENLINVILPNTITSIGTYTFQGCKSLTSISIPNSVTNIEEGAFRWCPLTNITIPSSVNRIGEKAFYECRNLASITSLSTTAPQLLGSTVFYGVDQVITINIPCGSLQSYSSNWSYFNNFNFIDDWEYTVTALSGNENFGEVSILTQPTCSNPIAKLKAVAKPGYHFNCWNDGETTNPRSVRVKSDTTFTAIFAQGTDVENVESVVQVYTKGNAIYINGARDESLVIYDVYGRVIYHGYAEDNKPYDIPQSGVYIVKVGINTNRKVVIMK